MAKSWLKQKTFKQKVYRERARGVMKRFSADTVKAGSRPNPDIVQWYKNAAESLKIGVGVDFEDLAKANAPKVEANWERIQLKNARPEWLNCRLVDDGFLRARMYFQLSPERCCIVCLDKRTMKIRRSVVYRSRDRCLARWKDGSIDWSPEHFHPSIPETFGLDTRVPQ